MRYITGFHGIEEIIRGGSARSQGELHVATEGPRIKKIMEAAVKAGISVKRVDRVTLDRAAPDNRGAAFVLPEGSEADLAVGFEAFLAAFDKPGAVVLVLDHLSDPHNYGAILRSADVFGVDLVVVPQKRAVRETDVVSRASAGAVSYVPVATVANLARALDALKDAGFWCYAADMDGQDVRSAELPARMALVLGSEGSGVSRLLKDTCDGALKIAQRGHVDSLNVSVAAGVFLYEIASRQNA